MSFPFRPDHWFCLPILFRLYRSTQTVAREGGEYFTRPELALQMLNALCTAVIAHHTALWYKAAGGRLLRIVAVKPLTGGGTPQAFYTTALEATPTDVLVWYARRWALEVTFHDAKGYLGFQQPQGWSRQAVQRTAPMAMLLYTLICLWFANQGHAHCTLSHPPWYPHKNGVAFPDMLRTLREQCLRQDFQHIIADTNLIENHRKELQMLIELAARAA